MLLVPSKSRRLYARDGQLTSESVPAFPIALNVRWLGYLLTCTVQSSLTDLRTTPAWAHTCCNASPDNRKCHKRSLCAGPGARDTFSSILSHSSLEALVGKNSGPCWAWHSSELDRGLECDWPARNWLWTRLQAGMSTSRSKAWTDEFRIRKLACCCLTNYRYKY